MVMRLFPVLAAVFPLLLMYASRGTVAALVLLAVAGLVDAAMRRSWRLPLSLPAVSAGALFLLYAVASELWAQWDGMVLPKWAALAGVALAGVVALGAVAGRPAPDPLALRRLAAWGLWLAAALALVEAVTRMSLSIALITVLDHAPAPSAVLTTRFKVAASVLALWGTLLVGLDLRDRRWLSAAVSAAAAATMAVVSHSLVGVLALSAAAATYAVARLVPRAATVLVAGLAVVMLAVPVLVRELPTVERLATDYPGMPNSALHRIAIWEFGLAKALERPWLGWGLDASRRMDTDGEVAFHQLNKPGIDRQVVSLMPLHPHNIGIQVLLELGVAGSVLLALFLVAVARHQAVAPAATRAAWLATTVAGYVVASVAFGAWQSWWLSCLWIVAALAIAAGREPYGRAQAPATR